MDYALQYSKDQKVIEAINHIRLFKKMILLCKLVRFKGRRVEREISEWQEQSSATWNINFKVVPKPHKRLIEVWSELAEWASEQRIDTIVGFNDKIRTKCKVSEDTEYEKCNVQNEEYYEEEEMRYRQQIHKRINNIENIEWRKSITEMKPNKSLAMHDMFSIACDVNINNINVPFNNEITESMIQGKAAAAIDASAKEFSAVDC